MKKVLIFTISNGDAYNMVGRSIVNALVNRYPSVTFRMVDVSKGNKGINFQLSEEETLSQKLAHRLERHRYIKCKDSSSIEKAKKTAEVYLKGIREFVKYNIKNFEPNVIIATHAFPAIILSELRENHEEIVNNTILSYVECNYVLSPYIKLATNLDYYFCPTDDSVKVCKKYGISSKHSIVPFGIPILASIENITDKVEARDMLNIPEDKFVILITNGESQSDHTLSLIKNIINKYDDVYIVCVCAKNVKLRSSLNKWIKSKKIKNVKVIGHTNNLGILLSACDCVMGKTIGVEVAESFAKGLPYISTLKIRGQELDNMKYLKSKNAILNGRTIPKAIASLDNVRKNKKIKNTLLVQSGKLYKFNATDELIKLLYHTKKAHRELDNVRIIK